MGVGPKFCLILMLFIASPFSRPRRAAPFFFFFFFFPSFLFGLKMLFNIRKPWPLSQGRRRLGMDGRKGTNKS
ncbi:hypothetical protein IWX49DRAFT_565746 [Phyllosticta citricarpa]